MEQHINRQHKDRLIRLIFGSSREDALSLYNALNDSSYTNAEDLEFTTIDDVIFMGMKNDISFLFQMEMSLYEHQSTWSSNYPLRGLLYFARLYEAYLEKRGKRLYNTRLIKLPTPHYVVLYNGKAELPDRKLLRLSDAFEHPGGCIELTATVYNINAGHNKKLLENCRRLGDYAELIARIRDLQYQGYTANEAVVLAVDSCIRDGILEDILRKHKAEVIGMLLTEYDEAEAEQIFRAEGYEEGLEEGLEQGLEQGREQEREQGLRALMQSTGWNLQRAMDAMMIPPDARPAMERRLSASSGT